jgi:hypothetical protein
MHALFITLRGPTLQVLHGCGATLFEPRGDQRQLSLRLFNLLQLLAQLGLHRTKGVLQAVNHLGTTRVSNAAKGKGESGGGGEGE